jgi:hypothetical protein
MFEWRSKAVIEHNFNDHLWCNPAWCAILRKKDLTQKKNIQCKHCSKLEDMSFYVQAKKAIACYTTKEALRDLRHGFHSNKCEWLNGFITNSIPKNKHTCLSNINKAHINMNIGIDSLGYKRYFKRLFAVTGLDYNEVTRHHHQHLDRHKATQSFYKKKTESKRKRRRLLYAKIAAGNLTAEESCKEGYDYGPGLIAPEDDDEGVGADVAETSKAEKLVVGCDKHGKSDHKMTRSMKRYDSTNRKVSFTRASKKLFPRQLCHLRLLIICLLQLPGFQLLHSFQLTHPLLTQSVVLHPHMIP